MNKQTARKLKLYTVAILLGAGLAIHLSHSVVKAQVVEKIEKPWKVTRYVITESAIIAQYTLGKYAGNEYAQYIWNKWAGDGNRAQAVALCTNIAEGHLDDSATNVNVNNEGTDRGCWMWNDKYHPDVSDDVARNCFKATDLTYNVWAKRMNMGVQDGFAGMWYGYGSRNYTLCMDDLTSAE